MLQSFNFYLSGWETRKRNSDGCGKLSLFFRSKLCLCFFCTFSHLQKAKLAMKDNKKSGEKQISLWDSFQQRKKKLLFPIKWEKIILRKEQFELTDPTYFSEGHLWVNGVFLLWTINGYQKDVVKIKQINFYCGLTTNALKLQWREFLNFVEEVSNINICA